MEFSTVTLEAKEVSSTVSYLSELLELDVEPLSEHEIILKSESLRFKVVPGAKAKNKGNIVFDLNVETEEELEEISQKAQFLLYRYGESCSIEENMNDNLSRRLDITDPDGRRWRFNTLH